MEIRELHSLRHCTQYTSLLFRLLLLSQPYGDVEFFSLDFLWCDFDNVSFQLSANNAVIFISKPIVRSGRKDGVNFLVYSSAERDGCLATVIRFYTIPQGNAEAVL